MNSTYDPLVGHVLDGRYEILAKLARGGMATVYRARDLRLMRTVAVKVMRRDLGEDDDFAAKFDHEARAAATINHPAVVGVFDQGSAEGQPYIVMEFVEGETLRRRISREAPFAPDKALELLEPVVAALACAHEAGLVHRDIKPENVLISTRGQVKVADFGLARLMASPQMTATGVLVGTASYLPPELVTHSRPDSRSDVYSAGVVLFELLTGTKPHTGENNYQIAYRHVNVDIEKPSTTLRNLGQGSWRIPDYVDAFVAACTARDPESRPFDGREMLEQLRDVRRELTVGGGRDNRVLADRLRPEHSLPEDLTQAIQPRPAARPRPLTGATSSASPAENDPVPMWRPTNPASPQSPATTSHRGNPISPTVEDSGSQPRSQRTPVFPSLNISQKPEHRRRRGALLMALLLLLTAVAGVGSWWYTAGRFTTVPSISEVSEAQAWEAVQANSLTPESRTEYSEDVAAGLVISTDPGGGTRVMRGETVELVISLGPERFGMPKVVGLTREDAVSTLESANLAVGDVVEAWSEETAVGVVMSASQEPDTPLKRDTPIDLTVSKGPEPLTIENFADATTTAESARKQLEETGFEVKVTQENSTTVAKGLLVSQSPSSGTGKRGDTITLVESLGPVMVVIPDVRYKSVDDATKILEGVGFVVKVEYSSEFPLSLKIAAGTDPGSGTSVPEGSEVVLLVV
ncbi:MAG: Stk1 family PASTA domain-containing Ser/Thr kinase [Propionibacteriaceae bacterium]|nr:Stk1 family PASTA domain-containing Ser/Thr kinase [Propionibacteriaceae bacterium]